MARYSIVLIPNSPDAGYTVTVPALPGCITYGQDRDEAVVQAKQAILGFIEAMEEAGETVPEESSPVEVVFVDIAVRPQ